MKRAFTLIELLVVIAIIAILAAILFPVFAQAKAAAKTSACLSNSKQIGLGNMQYVTDNDGMYPLNWSGDGNPNWEFWWQTHPLNGPNAGVASKWMDAIYPYIKNEQVFTCPTQAMAESGKYVSRERLTQRSPVTWEQPETRRWGSYCTNNGYWGPGAGTPASSDRNHGTKSETTVEDPSGSIWAMDSNGSYQCSWEFIEAQPTLTNVRGVPQLGIQGGDHPYEGAVVFRHSNRANVIWTDGHSKSLSPGDATQKVTDNTKPTFNAYRRFTIEED